jgi:hypothetical protein
MLPALHLFVTVGTVVAERVLYLPSAGACMLAGLAVSRLAEGCGHRDGGGGGSADGAPADVRSPSPSPLPSPSPAVSQSRPAARVSLTCTLVAIFALSVRTVVRNQDWVRNEALFSSALAVCPDSAKMQMSMGVVRALDRRLAEARGYFERSIAISNGPFTYNQTYGEPYFCLAKSLKDTGDLDGAAPLYREAIVRDGRHAGAHHEYGTLLIQQGKRKPGLALIETAAKLSPRSAGIANDRASALAIVGRRDAALAAFDHAISLAYVGVVSFFVSYFLKKTAPFFNVFFLS